MEKESIAYFYLQKNTVAKDNLFSGIMLNEFCVERRDRLIIKVVGIPEYYMEGYSLQLKHFLSEKILHGKNENIKVNFSEKKKVKKEKVRDTKGKEIKKTVKREKKKEAGEKGNKILWEREKLIQVLGEEFQKSGAEYFFCGEETALFLGQKPPEVPLFFMEEMLVQYGVRERLILIGNYNLFFESVFQNFMQKVNFLRIICDESDAYEEAGEWLYENYGIVMGIGAEREVEERRFRREKIGTEKQREEQRVEESETRKERMRTTIKRGQPETLVIDMEPCGKNGRPRIDLTGLPEGTIYMDMCSEGAKARWITKKRKDIHYLSPESLLNKWCHLDTTAQNGYNTRVKLEVL